MAQITNKEFEGILKADEGLRQRFEEALKAVTEAANDGEAIQKAAAQLGYELSLEELEQAWAAAQELDEAEMGAVTGGTQTKDGHWTSEDDWCVANYFCYTAWSHDDVPGMHYESCWSNYYCAIFYHH